ncbi:MAG TPA: ATP-dependent helicase [Polyangia bacterium]|nr:ATP-dependent helicase [Polyangia bacterium]
MDSAQPSDPSNSTDPIDAILAGLNPAQRRAAGAGDGPLLVIAGAGTGKTQTLAHRVATLIARGADARRILLLTFSRRAAQEMTRRAARLLNRRPTTESALPWAGTFHAVANRLLRHHAQEIGLDPGFTLLDREDSADLLDRLRHDAGLAHTDRRFPRKGTCLAIYSSVVNTQEPLRACLETRFPWCLEWEEPLRSLFASYVEAKSARAVLDYDDLLLYWFHLMSDGALAARVRSLFDHVLVDEYQDTNTQQAEILRLLKPDGHGVTVVGDDAQAIYSFRAARVGNILAFANQYQPPATVETIEQNYRSTQPILAAANAVIGLGTERYEKRLFSARPGGERPVLATVADEPGQVDYVVTRILERREAGVPLRQQAVLFRSSHHSDALEVELGRRNLPFVKFGGLRFLESAHVKDALSCLRWAENPRDSLAAFRVAQLLPGMGPRLADALVRHVAGARFALPPALATFDPPAAARTDWPAFADLFSQLCGPVGPWATQMGLVRRWYQPHLERLYDDARVRLGDLEQLEQLAAAAPSRERFLSDLTLDPPQATGAEAGPPHLDEDYLILSTIHSAKGQEWDTVFVLNAADGCIPSDLATGTAPEIEEERRLLYVAMTRAKNSLALIHPLRFFIRQQSRHGDRHVFTPRTRFIPDAILDKFERAAPGTSVDDGLPRAAAGARLDIAARLKASWATPKLVSP